MLFDLVDKDNLRFYVDMIPKPVRTLLDKPGMITVGVCDEAKDGVDAAGVMMITLAKPDKVGVVWIYVSPGYRDYDFGTMLLSQAFALAKEQKRSGVEIHLPSDESEGFFTARGFLRKNDENDTTGAIVLYADVNAFKHAEEAVAESEKWEDECFKKEQDFPKNLRVVSVEYYGGEVVDF